MNDGEAGAAPVRVGCSGWDYLHWKGTFYPARLPRSRWLEQYARVFDTVELNNSFYRLPTAERFAAWKARVPETFRFAVKASRYLTHVKRLKDPADPMRRLLEAVAGLGSTLGPILYQLPPRWVPDTARLQAWLETLPPGQHAVEFRDSRAYTLDILNQLAAARVALCVHDMAGSAAPRQIVGPFLYLRFHGSTGRYAGAYPPEVLRDWALWTRAAARGGCPAFVYFNNDVAGQAPRDAQQFREWL